jgi:predicted DNA-binding transcriptional regulator YafY
LWFTSSEIYALLAAHKVLADIEPGILAERLAPVQTRLMALLESAGQPAGEVADRVRLLSMGRRHIEPRHFARIAKALLERRRLRVIAYVRERDEETERVVSPQRLVHYRDNWYLDCWCHLRGALRTFAVENIRQAHALAEPAKEIPEEQLKDYFASAYGIFAGAPTETAVLRFTPEKARWVEAESWHPQQQGEHLDDGSYRLRIPYGDPRELMMDILRHGASVAVEAPDSLRQIVAAEASKILRLYDK